eukprot:5817414-Amphidinium_carterae.1
MTELYQKSCCWTCFGCAGFFRFPAIAAVCSSEMACNNEVYIKELNWITLTKDLQEMRIQPLFNLSYCNHGEKTAYMKPKTESSIVHSVL